MIQRLPEDAQTLHAEALALLLALESERGWSHLSGSFSNKVVKGTEYVYFQYSDPGGKKRQFSIGKREPALDAVIEAYTNDREQHQGDLDQLDRLAGLLRAAGLMTMPHGPARVVRALADAGVFRLGGVLVGSYAPASETNLDTLDPVACSSSIHSLENAWPTTETSPRRKSSKERIAQDPADRVEAEEARVNLKSKLQW